MGKLITVCAFVLCMGSVVQANDDDKSGQGPCAKDRETLCANMEPGEGLMKCMMENKEKFSAECKEHHEKMREQRKENLKGIKEACHGDAEKFCGDIKHGKGRIMKCMKSHKEDLSEGCKQEVESMKEKHKKNRKASKE